MPTPLLRACVAPVLTSGAVTSDASTAIGDLIVFIGWAQGTDVTTISATLSDATNSWLNHSHNDGTTDARLLIAVRKATVAGAQSYTPWSISGATSGQISIGQYIVQAGTYDESIIASLPAANLSAVSDTGNSVPNTPQLTPIFNVDYLFLSIAGWHITSAGTTDAGAPTNYTMRGENDPGSSHVTHLAITDRTITNMVAAENPGGFTDNVVPNGSVSCSLCIPGNRSWTADAPGSATAAGFDGTFAEDSTPWTADAPGSATASGFDGTFSPSGDASWTADAPGSAAAAGFDGPLSATGNTSWSADVPGSAAATGFDAPLSATGNAPWSADAPGSAAGAGFEGALAPDGNAAWQADAPGSASAVGFEGELVEEVAGTDDWNADAPGSATAAGFEGTFSPTSVEWHADGPGSASAAGFEGSLSPTTAPWTADAPGSAVAAGFEGALSPTGDASWAADAPGSASAQGADAPLVADGTVSWAADAPGAAAAVGFEAALLLYIDVSDVVTDPPILRGRLATDATSARGRLATDAPAPRGRITTDTPEVLYR